tara:strand:+ start:493 stop:879 length:387 start_codon:yes stop_codon:yes gene_type:complete
MAITRHEQQYYNNIERIATALEKLVAQGKEDKLNRFKQASNILYGNTAPAESNKGRSDENYTYPQFVKKHYNKVTDSRGENIRVPSINSDLDQRIYDESQSKTGGEFQAWHNSLTSEERAAYTRIYNF